MSIKNRFRTFLAVSICLLAAVSVTTAQYVVIDLGTLGGRASAALSINDAGQIVGEADDHATLFDPTGAGNNIDLGTLGGISSSAWSINDAGQIVGYAQDSQGDWRATLFDPTGAGDNIDLGTLGGDDSFAYSINNAGLIVGPAEYVPGSAHATLFDCTGTGGNLNLGTPGGDWSEAWSINDAGQIVGRANGRATLFDPTGAGRNLDLGTLGGDMGGASSINNIDQIVGWARNNAGRSHATLFDSTGVGSNIDLGTLGGSDSEAYSINDAGQIVGQAEDSEGEWHATLFDPTGAGNNSDLNTLIDPASGWTLVNAHDINASGWIVGKGNNSRGKGQAFLLVLESCGYSGGSGTAEDPYQIATAADLITLGETPDDYDRHFILTADIDLDPNLPRGRIFDRAVIAPDCNDSAFGFQGAEFSGVFNGNGYVIHHLVIQGTVYVGLFGQSGSGSSITNLALETTDVHGNGYVGGLVGNNNGGTIFRCHSNGLVTGKSLYIGGLVGCNRNNGRVSRCSSNNTVVGGHSNIGGLAGKNSGDIEYSLSDGTVTGDYSVGGLVGYNTYNIHSCSSHCIVDGWDAGGLVGENPKGSISCSTFTGSVSGWTTAGGLAGTHGKATISNSYSTGLVESLYTAGGLVGTNSGIISNCYNAGEVIGNSIAGGSVGLRLWDNGVDGVSNSFWDTEVSGTSYSAQGVAKTTAEMKTVSTFLDAGWDFIDETENGTEDIWKIAEGLDYPRLWWEAYDGQITVELGQVFAVTLESNPSTGYRWEWIDDQDSIVEQFGEAEFVPRETGNPPLVGAGGWEVFTFKATSPGQMVLRLVYRRLWEEGVEPLKTFSLLVVVP